jgi:hypothetical protein
MREAAGRDRLGRVDAFLAVDFFAILFPPTIGQPMAVENQLNGICTCPTDAMSTRPARRFFPIKFEQNRNETMRIYYMLQLHIVFSANDPINH